MFIPLSASPWRGIIAYRVGQKQTAVKRHTRYNSDFRSQNHMFRTICFAIRNRARSFSVPAVSLNNFPEIYFLYMQSNKSWVAEKFHCSPVCLAPLHKSISSFRFNPLKNAMALQRRAFTGIPKQSKFTLPLDWSSYHC